MSVTTKVVFWREEERKENQGVFGGLKQPSEASWDANNNYVQRGEGTKLFFDHAPSQPTLGSRLLGKSPRTALATNLAATAMMRWSRDHCDPKTRD